MYIISPPFEPPASARFVRPPLPTLGRFEIRLNGTPLASSGKIPKKPLELLKALIAHGARCVSAATLATDLWPDADGCEALNSLTVALHRLRQLLGHPKAIRKQDDEICIDRSLVWVDAWAFEELLLEARKPLRDGGEAQGDTHQAIACYRDGLEIDHLSEEFYQQFMLCYLQAGLHAEAAVVWECCKRNLALHLAINPSPRTREIYRMITE